ncbi:MAG: acetyl-coenzyme A synthetase N-terminal domain-containing protein, partial [Bacteroidota bacterium]
MSVAYPFQIRSAQDYREACAEARENPEAFWSGVAEHFRWKRKWDKVLDWNFDEPRIEWFKGAQLNITEN